MINYHDEIVKLVLEESSHQEINQFLHLGSEYLSCFYQEVFILSIPAGDKGYANYSMSVSAEEFYKVYKKYLRLKAFK